MLNNNRYYRRNGIRKESGYFPLQVGSTPAFMNFNMIAHELARGYQVVYAQL